MKIEPETKEMEDKLLKLTVITDSFKEYELDIMELFYYQYVEDYQITMDQDPLSKYPVKEVIVYKDNEISNKVIADALKKYHIIHNEFETIN